MFMRSVSATHTTKEETAMKKFFGALIAASFIFAAVFASASVLPLVAGTGSIQSSNLANVTCQNAQVTVKYGTELNGQGENQIASVTISGIESTCFGDQAAVNLFKNDPPYSGLNYGPANADVWIQWGTISASSITLPFGTNGVGGTSTSPKPLAADVQHYNVMFSAQ
jgi:hypothetical protein